MEKLIKIAVLAFTELRMAQRVTGKMPAAAMCVFFAFFTGLGMLGCGVAAFWLYLAPHVGNAEAALWSAAVLMLLTGGLGVAASLNFRSGGNPTHRPGLESIGAELSEALAQNKGSVLLSALLAGMAFGNGSRK